MVQERVKQGSKADGRKFSGSAPGKSLGRELVGLRQAALALYTKSTTNYLRTPAFVAKTLHGGIIVSLQYNSSTMTPSLADSLERYQISLPKVQVRKLDEYCRLLWDWNERVNLTRHTDYDKFVARDVVDSLALAEFLRTGERILDVGTGGGVPGILLAILRPDLRIELCDSTGKKALAVSEILQELRLNIPVHHAKADAVLSEKGRRFTTLTIRAVSRLVSLLRHVAPHWSSFDRMLLIKGPKWVEERGEARHYNLMTKIALRCVKTYSPHSPSSPKTSESQPSESQVVESEVVESFILQLCLKENLDQLDKIIDGHIRGKGVRGRRERTGLPRRDSAPKIG